MNKYLDKSVDVAWNDALSSIIQLNRKGVRIVFNRTQNIEAAFRSPKRSLICVDEGVGDGIHLPGSGVLMSPTDRREAILRAGALEFTTHDYCRAFVVAFPGESNPNRACREWGEQEAASLGIPFRHISTTELERPEDFHIATVIYYDATGAFSHIDGLPAGFVVSRKHFATAQNDLGLCLNVAFGIQGFGERFTAKYPLHVIPLAHPNDSALSLRVLESEVREVVAPFGRRVRVCGVKTAWHMRAAA